MIGKVLSIPACVLKVVADSLPPEPPEWVRVRDRSPERGQSVVMYSRLSGAWVGVYQGDGTKHRWSSFYELSVDGVTHWFPMPLTPSVSRRVARKI